MKQLFSLLIFQLTIHIAGAQISLTQNGDAYKVACTYYNSNTKSMQEANFGSQANFSPTNPGHTVWYEFGDGRFTTKPSFRHSYSTNTNINNTVLKINGIYENGGKPTRILSGSSFIKSNNTSNNYLDESNDLLNRGFNVKVTSNVSDISFNDTMHFAIDYIVPTSGKLDNWKLVFEYNTNRADFFYQTSKNYYLKDAYDNSIKAPFVRTHFGEKINDDYYNRVEFTNLIKEGFIKTVFVTLISKSNKDAIGAIGGVSAYLINDNEKSPNAANQDQSSLRNLGDKPHDPNFIKVDKKCIKPNTLGMELNYHVHFQNTGTGNADDLLHIAIKLPTNISAAQLNPITSGLQINCATNPITQFMPYKKPSNSSEILTSNSKNYLPGIAYYDITTDNDSVHYLIKQAVLGNNIILHGMDTTKPNHMNNTKTMGDIFFKIKLPSYKAPSDLIAQAAIVFDTEHHVLTEEELTKVRKRCKKPKKEADCNCSKGKKRTFKEWLKEKSD
jgi:hypothetical protein